VVVLGTSDACSVAIGSGSSCQSGGSCIPNTNGNICQCRPGDRGTTCATASWTFQPLSYAERTNVHYVNSDHLELSFDVSTIQQRALLIYLADVGSRVSAFVAVEVLSGRVQVSFLTLGAGGVARVSGPAAVSDGRWHHIVVVLTSQVGCCLIIPASVCR